MIKAPINRILSFSNVDGPGNRSVIFFQGCPLRCLYCHNPETINQCINCKKCVGHCDALSVHDDKGVWDKSRCTQCDNCIKVCKHLSSPKINWMSTDDIVQEIKKVKPFIRGITVSGGECMEHPEFLLELFGKVKQLDLTCFIDTNGCYDFKLYPKLLSLTDGVMLDVKAYDSAFHQQLTMKDNAMIISNLHYLIQSDKIYEVRTVLVNNYSRQNEHTVREVAAIIKNNCRYKLIKYRPYGVRLKALSKMGNLELPDEEIKRCESIAKLAGASQIITT